MTRLYSTFSRTIIAGAVVLLLGLATSCTYTNGDPTPCNIAAETITYAGVISPIFDANCRECHGTNTASALGGGIGLGDYQHVKQYPGNSLMGSIRHDPGSDPMPKGRAKISDCDIRRLQAWMDAGSLNN